MKTADLTAAFAAVPAMVLAAVLTLWAAGADARAVLNTEVVVQDDVVRIGDIWRNAGENADAVIGYAPKLGEQAVLRAGWLRRVAKAYKVDWAPVTAVDQSVVERASYIVTRDEIADELELLLVAHGGDPDLIVELSRRLPTIQVTDPESATMAFDDLTYNRRDGRFSAILRIPADGQATHRLRLTGTTHKMVQVPMLSRSVEKGGVIGGRDVRMVSLRSDRVDAGVILDPEQVIGMAPTRRLLSDVPILHRDVRLPLEVERKRLVTLYYRTKFMVLTAQGRALESGARGDLVRVLNTQSNKVVQAEVTGPDKATVVTADQLVMN